MPPLPPVATVLKFTIEGDTPVNNWVNVLHWNYTGGAPTNAHCADLADALFGLWGAQFGPQMLTSAHVLKATCVDLSSALGGSGERSGSIAGSAGTGDIPGSAAVLVKKSIDRRYRGGHPRSYIYAGIQTDMLNPSHWTDAFTTAIEVGYTAMRAGMDGLAAGATTLAVEVTVSYVDTATTPLPPHRRIVPLVFPVRSFTTTPLIATQRRRIGR